MSDKKRRYHAWERIQGGIRWIPASTHRLMLTMPGTIAYWNVTRPTGEVRMLSKEQVRSTN